MSNRRDLANGILSLGVSDTDTTWVLENGYGAGMPEVPFYITATPFGQLPTLGNSEIVNVTAMDGDTLTVTRGAKGTTAKAFDAGAVVANAIYADEKWTSENIDFTKFDVTSTTEKVTGKLWIDGKPIYRKAVVCSGAGNNATVGTAHGISNLKYVVNSWGYIATGAGGTITPIEYQNASGDGVTTYFTSTQVQLVASGNRTSYTDVVVVMEYTKTTD